MYAAVGTNGTRLVVWGIGRSEAAARRDAVRWLVEAEGEPVELEVHRITAAQAARVKRGTIGWPISRSGPSGPSTPRAERTRRKIELSLSAEAHARLDTLATGTSRSAVVERLILSQP